MFGKEINLTRGMIAIVDEVRAGFDISVGMEVDHINSDRLLNTRSNLRSLRKEQSRMNKGKPFRKNGKECTSRFKGVTYYKGDWIAQIRARKTQHRIGIFESEIRAAEAYNVEALRHFGGLARLNSFAGG